MADNTGRLIGGTYDRCSIGEHPCEVRFLGPDRLRYEAIKDPDTGERLGGYKYVPAGQVESPCTNPACADQRKEASEIVGRPDEPSVVDHQDDPITESISRLGDLMSSDDALRARRDEVDALRDDEHDRLLTFGQKSFDTQRHSGPWRDRQTVGKSDAQRRTRRITFRHGSPARRDNQRGHRYFLGARLEPEWDQDLKSFDKYRWVVDTARIQADRFLIGAAGNPFRRKSGGGVFSRGVHYRYENRRVTLYLGRRFVEITHITRHEEAL